MPNRILRDWTDSDRINELSPESERFFVRLIMKADDFGRYFADPKKLKAFLFPLKDSIRETDCSRWLAECEKAGLLRCYDAAGKRFLEMPKFQQRLRIMQSKFPPPSDDRSPPSDDRALSSETKRNETNQKRIEQRRSIGGRLSKLFNRTEIDVWSYAEESTLFELLKRPAFETELGAIEVFFSKNPKYLPESLATLLSRWTEILDRSRNYERNQRNNSKSNSPNRNAGTYNANTSNDGLKSKVR